MTKSQYLDKFPGAEIVSEATHLLMSENSSMRNNPETRRKVSVTHTGMKRSTRHCAAISKAHKGKTLSPEHRAGIGRGVRRFDAESDSRKKAISKATKGRPAPWARETCKKRKGKKATPEHRANMRIGRLKWIEENYETAVAVAANMRAHSKFLNTSIEKAVEDTLKKIGVEYETQGTLSFLPGRMRCHRFDFVVRSARLAIEADGCFFHGCECANGRDYCWILEQRKRDVRQTLAVQEAGWCILRLWEHDISSRPEWVEAVLTEAIQELHRAEVKPGAK